MLRLNVIGWGEAAPKVKAIFKLDCMHLRCHFQWGLNSVNCLEAYSLIKMYAFIWLYTLMLKSITLYLFTFIKKGCKCSKTRLFWVRCPVTNKPETALLHTKPMCISSVFSEAHQHLYIWAFFPFDLVNNCIRSIQYFQCYSLYSPRIFPESFSAVPTALLVCVCGCQLQFWCVTGEQAGVKHGRGNKVGWYEGNWGGSLPRRGWCEFIAYFNGN